MNSSGNSTTHALCSPSAFGRWGKCKVSLSYDQPKGEPSAASKEGTEAAAIGEHMLKAKAEHPDFDFDAYARSLPAPFDDYMAGYCDYVMDIYGRGHIEAELFVESGVSYNEHLFGTPDAAVRLMKEDGSTELHIIDLKFGKGVLVPINAKQTALYARLFIEEHGTCDRIFTHIYQPRMSNEGYVEYTMDTLCDITDSALDFADKLVGSDTFSIKRQLRELEANAGNHCTWCPGIGKCRAQYKYQQRESLTVIDELPVISDTKKAKAAIKERVRDLTTEEQLKIFEQRDLVKELLSSVAIELQGKASRGESVPGYKLVRTTAKRSLNQTSDTAAALKEMGIKNPYQPAKLITLGTIDKVLGKEKAKELKPQIDRLCSLSNTSLQLVPDTDKRVEEVPAQNLIDQLGELK